MFIWHDRRDYLHVIFSFRLAIIDRNGSNRRSTYGSVSEKDMVYSGRGDKNAPTQKPKPNKRRRNDTSRALRPQTPVPILTDKYKPFHIDPVANTKIHS